MHDGREGRPITTVPSTSGPDSPDPASTIDRTHEPALARPPFDPPAARDALRLTSVYATDAVLDAKTIRRTARPVSEFLRLGRLSPFYETSRDQLPAVLGRRQVDPASLSFERWTDGVEACWLWLFALPSGQLAVGFSVDVRADLIDVIPLLEDLYYASLELDRGHLESQATAVAAELGLGIDAVRLLPERHQLVFVCVPEGGTMPDPDTMQRVVYRADLPHRNGDSAIRYPGELNRRPTTMGALGPYVSVIVGLQDYVENAALLSAVQVVTGSSRLRQIRQRAYECVATLRTSTEDDDLQVRERRLVLEDISETLRELELELSFSVEAVADLGMLVPALRVESYHDALIDSMSLTRRASTTGRMLERLRNAIDAELTSIESTEARADDARRIRTVAAVTFVTTVAGTIGLVFTFFGINARQVDQTRSIFDSRYMGIYILVGIITILAGGIYLFPSWLAARRKKGTWLALPNSKSQHILTSRHAITPQF